MNNPGVNIPGVNIPVHRGLSAVAQDYDAFILDLWGTLHDGVALYPGALGGLKAMAAAGKAAVFLSNAPRRAAAAQEKLDELGVPRGAYTGIVTSGEAAHRLLAEHAHPWIAPLGRRLYHLGPDRDDSVHEGTGSEMVADPALADVVLNTGTRSFEHTVDDYRDEMAALLARRVPMLCANPDRVIVRQGQRVICAGALAEAYEAGSGDVHWVGKPDPEVFGLCLEMLGTVERDRVLMVGDSLHTDIAGARAAGIPSAFVTGGIHGAELGADYGEPADPARVAALCASAGEAPAAAVPGLFW